MASLKDLQAQVKTLRAENKALKAEGFSFFHTIPENSEIADMLRSNKIPYFKKASTLSWQQNSTQPDICLIEGDNLGVLSALQFNYTNKVDVIYIDPPYNTGKGVYTYTDTYNFSRIKRDKQQTFNRHSSWLSFMESRLVLARNLLRETGVIMCAISSEEFAHLKLLMDSIFGEENFIANVTWAGSVKNNARYVSVSSDYMLIYVKNAEALKTHNIKWRAPKPSAQALLKIANDIWNKTLNSEQATKELREFHKTLEARAMLANEPGLKMYNSIDEEGRLYRASDLSSPSGKGGRYKIVNPNTGNVVAVPARGWVHSEKTFQQKIVDNQILWNDDNVPAYKRFLEDSTSIVLKDVIAKDRDASNKLLQKMIGRGKFSYPKDHYVLAEWIDYVTPDFRREDKKDPPIVLDFFAGSGSTGHAVAYLNSQDNGARECILITNNENEIAETVTAPRMKAALTGNWVDGKNEQLPGNLQYFKMKMYASRQAPKTSWDYIPYSEAYVESMRELIREMKLSGLI